MTRALWVLLHRWVGLTIAAFLFVSGITGAVISWDHELDDLLNPHLTGVESHGEFLPVLELTRAVEERDPRVLVTYAPLRPAEGRSVTIGVSARVDPSTQRLYDIDYNEVFVSERLSLLLNADNVTDEAYLNSLFWADLYAWDQAFYGEPRSVTARLTYEW